MPSPVRRAPLRVELSSSSESHRAALIDSLIAGALCVSILARLLHCCLSLRNLRISELIGLRFRNYSVFRDASEFAA